MPRCALLTTLCLAILIRSSPNCTSSIPSCFSVHVLLDHDPDEERDEVVTFADDGHADSSSSSADRKTSTISVTLREEVIKSGPRYSK